MNNKNLSEQEILDAISLEQSLSKKRSQNELFEAKYNFGQCRVCKSKATGIHYGVCSCEGCKGFFKRSLVRYKGYICRGDKNCLILPKDTRKCKFCRWMACNKAGMCVSQVRVGRIPNYMKEIKLKNENQEKNMHTIPGIRKNKFCLYIKYLKKHEKVDQQFLAESGQFFPKNLYTQKYLNSSSQNQLVILSCLRDKACQIFLEQIEEFHEHEIKARTLILSNYKPIKIEMGSDLARKLRKKDTLQMERHAASMFQFIEQLPGFQRISGNDLQIVLRERFFSVYALRTLKLFINNEFYFMFGEIPMTSDIFAFLTSDLIRDSHYKFFSHIQKLNLTAQELALTIPIILTMISPTERLENAKIIQELREYYFRALFYQFSLKNRSQQFIEIFIKIISFAPVIDKLCQELDFGEEMYA
uniref:Nuclear receptor n=1 Tax=Brachionus plicatilis TaxID=10195 RepID=A0A221CB48_BRAPC|nr:nuclear receptor [Brachionus plicatilis]